MSEQSIRTSNTKKLIAVSLGHFVNDCYVALIAPLSYLFAIKLGLSLTQQGLISAIVLIFASFFQPFFGLLIDKRGKSGALIFSVAWIAVWISLSGIINNFYLLLFVIAIGSLASALYHPLGSTVSVNLNEKSKGTSLSIFMTIGGFAGSVSPIIGLWIAKTYGIEKIIFLVIPGIITALYMYKSKVSEIELHNKDKTEIEGEKFHIGKKRLMWLIILIYIMLSKTLIARFMITYGIQILTLKGVTVATLVLSIYLFLNPVGTMLGGILIDKISEKKVFILGIGAGLVCCSFVVFGNGILSAIAFPLFAFFTALANTASIMLSHKIIPNGQSFATGVIMGIPGGLGAILMLVFSSIADMKGLIFSSRLLIIPFVIALIFTAIIPYEFEQ